MEGRAALESEGELEYFFFSVDSEVSEWVETVWNSKETHVFNSVTGDYQRKIKWEEEVVKVIELDHSILRTHLSSE